MFRAKWKSVSQNAFDIALDDSEHVVELVGDDVLDAGRVTSFQVVEESIIVGLYLAMDMSSILVTDS